MTSIRDTANKILSCVGLHAPSEVAIRYSATTLGATLLSNLFYTFYIQLFLKGWSLSYSWFYAGQTLFMVWNAVNDPLFGWLQDNPSAKTHDNVVSYSRAIFIGGPLFAIASLLPWWSWTNNIGDDSFWTGIQFIVSLFCFDGLFTYVVLAQCGLFADIAESQQARSDVLAMSQIAQMLGSLGTFISLPLWEATGISSGKPELFRMTPFRIFAICLAFISGICFLYTGKITKSANEKSSTENDARVEGYPVPEPNNMYEGEKSSVKFRHGGASITTMDALEYDAGDIRSFERNQPSAEEEIGLFLVYKQIITNKNFLKFVAVNILQIFNNTFNNNFYAEFMETLFASSDAASLFLSTGWRSALLGFTNFLPACIALALTPLMKRIGHSYPIVRGLLWIKLGMSIFVGFFGSVQSSLGLLVVACFMLTHKSLAAANFSFFNMTVSDLIDDDMKRHKRERRLGTSFFGLNALLTTPAVSLAPMITVYVLSRYGYTSSSEISSHSSTDIGLRDVMFQLVWITPAICAALQLTIWSSFSLRGEEQKDTIASHSKTKASEQV